MKFFARTHPCSSRFFLHYWFYLFVCFNGNVDKAKLDSFLMLTSPGTPFIYYGEEVGMQGQKPDEDIRLPMQWSADEYAGLSMTNPWRAPRNDYEQVNVALQSGDSNSLKVITDYALTLEDAGLVESAYSVETLFGAGQANDPERSGEAISPKTEIASGKTRSALAKTYPCFL